MTLSEAMAGYQAAVSSLRAKAKTFNAAQITYDKIVSEGKSALEASRSDYNSAVSYVGSCKTELELAIKAEASDLIHPDDKPITVVR